MVEDIINDKKAIVLMMLSLCVASTHAMSNIQIQKIYSSLKTQLPKGYKKIPLKIINTKEKCNAFSKYGVIEIYSSCLKVSNRSLAFILAHELAHQILSHFYREPSTGHNKEWDADMLGLNLYINHGYSTKGLIKTLNTELFKNRKSSSSSSHGSSKQRLNNIALQLEYLEMPK